MSNDYLFIFLNTFCYCRHPAKIEKPVFVVNKMVTEIFNQVDSDFF